MGKGHQSLHASDTFDPTVAPTVDQERQQCMMPQTRGNAARQAAVIQPKTPPQGSKWDEKAAKGLGVAGFSRDMVGQGADQLSKLGGEGAKLTADQSKVLGRMGMGIGGLFGFMGHLLGDEQVADSKAGHVANSAAKTGGDTLVSAAALENPALGGPPLAAIAAATDGMVGVDNPAKMATATAAELVPGSQAGKAISGGVDAMTALGNYAMGDTAAAYRGADQTQENAVNGNYGAIGQSLTYGMAGLTGDSETLNKATDRKAKTGERGFFNAWGNAATDLWDDDNNQAHGVKVYSNFEEYKKEQEARKWYNPLSW
ncbi:MAG: hypothetical protein GXP62_09270 [Oligoflexia bacterium]|nr:hypothetical protein [Oligoflexia bacterium]